MLVAKAQHENGSIEIWDDGNVSFTPSESTSIAWVHHDGKDMVVQYKSSPKYYRYLGVPYTALLKVMNAESAGKFIASEIKPNYEFEAFS